ncbi:MAG: hypothetical protein V9G19_02520 [Tetrasphaera sp.]
MRILLIGAGGGLDEAFLREASRRGHEIIQDGKLEPVEGRHRALSAAGQGSRWLHAASPIGMPPIGMPPVGMPPAVTPSAPDAVALLLPITSQRTTHAWSEAVDRLVERLDGALGTRVLALSSPRVDTPQESRLRAAWEAYIVEKVLRNPLLDLARMEAALRASDLSWTVVRAMPVRSGSGQVGADRARKDLVRIARDTRLSRPRGLSARALAVALLDVLEDPATERRIVEVG